MNKIKYSKRMGQEECYGFSFQVKPNHSCYCCYYVHFIFIYDHFQNLHHFRGEAIHLFESVRLAGDRRLIHSAEDQLMYSRYDSPPAHASVRTQNVVCNWQHATNVF